MNIQVLLPIGLFLAMGVAVIAATWRIVVAGGEARRMAQALRAASDVAHRADVCLTELAGALDDLRRGRLDGEQASLAVTQGLEKMRLFAAEGRACVSRSPSKAVEALSQDLDRAVRSIELVEHGRELLADLRGNQGEGETSVKRGYLNLLHAREAIRERGKEVRLEAAPPSALRALDRR